MNSVRLLRYTLLFRRSPQRYPSGASKSSKRARQGCAGPDLPCPKQMVPTHLCPWLDNPGQSFAQPDSINEPKRCVKKATILGVSARNSLTVGGRQADTGIRSAGFAGFPGRETRRAGPESPGRLTGFSGTPEEGAWLSRGQPKRDTMHGPRGLVPLPPEGSAVSATAACWPQGGRALCWNKSRLAFLQRHWVVTLWILCSIINSQVQSEAPVSHFGCRGFLYFRPQDRPHRRKEVTQPWERP